MIGMKIPVIVEPTPPASFYLRGKPGNGEARKEGCRLFRCQRNAQNDTEMNLKMKHCRQKT